MVRSAFPNSCSNYYSSVIMNTNYTIFLLALVLLLIMLHNYEEQEFLPTAAHCDPRKNICVACPHLSINI